MQAPGNECYNPSLIPGILTPVTRLSVTPYHVSKYTELDQGTIEVSGPRDETVHDVSSSPDSTVDVVGNEKMDTTLAPEGLDTSLGSRPIPGCALHEPGHLHKLGVAFLSRFKRLGQIEDLKKAISKFRSAVDHTSDGHPDKPSRLSDLGNAFRARFQRFGGLEDLEKAISSYSNAVHLTPDHHVHKPVYLHNLGTALVDRFSLLGEPNDLEEATRRNTDAVDLTPDDHPSKPNHLNSLGNAFRARYERFGDLNDLELAISRFNDAADQTPDHHPHKPGYLHNLGAALMHRFQRLGESSDLDEAISRHTAAVDLTPNDHPDKPGRLCSLGNCFRARFDQLKQPKDLEQAISKNTDAVELTPDNHPHKAIRSSSLGIVFRTCYEHSGAQGDFQQAVSMFKDAIYHTPDGHPHKPSYLHHLGITYMGRFKRHRNFEDLKQAILQNRSAVDLTPGDHPNKSRHLIGLGDCYKARYERFKKQSDLELAISSYSDAVRATTGAPTIRFEASQKWISCAREFGHNTLLDAYSVAIDLLPQIAWTGLSLSHRFRELMRGANVVREAAAAALESGDVGRAVEWLEQGRTIVWGELFQLRSSYDELLAEHPDLAFRLRELSIALEHASATHEKSMSSRSERSQPAENHGAGYLEREAKEQLDLAIQRDKLLKEIRGLSGFEQFLLRKKFSRLRASAHSGPVVILNAAQSRCDALIVLADREDAIHVQLDNFTLERSTRLRIQLRSLIDNSRVRSDDEREGRPVKGWGVSWESVLSVLWVTVVKPVLNALHFSTPGKLSRIFWCPTGPFAFLPIHASGLYDTDHLEPGHKLADFAISSYTPTLSILVSPEFDSTSCNTQSTLRFLAVRQPPTDGKFRLSGVNSELESIATLQRSSSIPMTLLEPPHGTVDEVLDLMKETDWVHFACHGIQDPKNPTDSGLCLAKESRLKMSDLVGLPRRRGGLAFLSACQTAMGDEHLSDEAIHIAAGMLFAGYGGVIATMRSIKDSVAPSLAKEVYEQLFDTHNGVGPDYKNAARALHEAVERLRRDPKTPVDAWLPFIHLGL